MRLNASDHIVSEDVVEDTIRCQHDDVIVEHLMRVVDCIVGEVTVSATLVGEVERVSLGLGLKNGLEDTT